MIFSASTFPFLHLHLNGSKVAWKQFIYQSNKLSPGAHPLLFQDTWSFQRALETKPSLWDFLRNFGFVSCRNHLSRAFPFLYEKCLQKTDLLKFCNSVFLAMLTCTLLRSGLLISTSSACILISVQLQYNIQIIIRFGRVSSFLVVFYTHGLYIFNVNLVPMEIT